MSTLGRPKSEYRSAQHEGTPMTTRITLHRLHVARSLQIFIDEQVLPGTGISSAHFWAGQLG